LKIFYKKRSCKSKFIKIFSALILIGFVFFIALESQIIFGYKYDMKRLKRHDVMIVLGCQFVNNTPSDLLYERLKKAEELYKKGYAKFIIVSGGKGLDENTSEAEGMKGVLNRDGIPKRYIIIEDKSHNTKENLENSKKIMQKHGFKDAIIVTNKFHVYRAMKLCSNLKINAVGIAAPMVKGRYDVTLFFYCKESLSLVKYYFLAIKSYF
jgi:uncharacterized SAM-binding protein YcdF (DUF218 family)